MTEYADLGDLPENARVDLIAEAVRQGHTVAFIVDDNMKADRYVRKLQDLGLTFTVVARGAGPVKDTIAVKVGPVTH